jgi:preprotein translocase subunit SecA
MSVQALQLLADAYPQRRDWGIAPVADRVLARVLALRHRLHEHRWHVASVVRQVRARLQEIDQVASEEGLQQRLSRNRQLLRKHGLDHLPQVVECLALACHMAHKTLGLAPFDTQLAAALHLVRRRAVELDTGEGKTLTAALVVVCAGQAGLPVHVVTANDYLAERDAQMLAPLYARFGLTVAVVTDASEVRQRAELYRHPVVYCSNKTVTFDYLRDRMVLGDRIEPLRLRLDRWLGRSAQVSLPGLVFAVVDEVDSVLVDEARTPLVLSRTIEDETVRTYVAQAVAMGRMLVEGHDFVFHALHRRPVLTVQGAERVQSLCEQLEAPSVIWSSQRRAEEAVGQALHALHGLLRDVHYVVREGKVMIVDENTGRVMADRSWEMGLHQMVEVKEGLELTGVRQTMARISYQLFFRRYLALCGMSGTCRELSGEFFDIYGMSSVRVAPRLPSRRRALGTRLYSTDAQRWQAVVRAIEREVTRGRSVLVGTRTVKASEILSALLAREGLAHQVLNAKQDADEAACIARAGEPGMVTIATNMAGRGTDIKLADATRTAGGLHVIVTEMQDNARVQRQLVGRCARQGDPGSWERLLSADDEFFRQRGRPWSAVLGGLSAGDGPRALRHALALGLLRGLQWAAERQHRRTRMQLLESDLERRDALGFSGVSE